MFTDDTAMTRSVARSFINKGKLDVEDMAKRCSCQCITYLYTFTHDNKNYIKNTCTLQQFFLGSWMSIARKNGEDMAETSQQCSESFRRKAVLIHTVPQRNSLMAK